MVEQATGRLPLYCSTICEDESELADGAEADRNAEFGYAKARLSERQSADYAASSNDRIALGSTSWTSIFGTNRLMPAASPSRRASGLLETMMTGPANSRAS